MRSLFAIALLLPILAGAPATARAAQVPLRLNLFSMPGAAAAIDPGGAATIADAAAGRVAFVPAGRFQFPNQAAYLRPVVVWMRVPADARWQTGTLFVETSFEVTDATLYAPAARGRWSATPFGMGVPYARRPVARLVPTANISAAAGGPLYLRMTYARESRVVAIVNASEIAVEDAASTAQEPGQIFFIGVFVTLALTNLVFFAYARSRLYLLYSVAMLLAAAYASVVYPFAWKWFWPNAAPPYFVVLALFAALFITSVVFFTSELLSVRRFWPGVDRFLRAFAVAAAVNGVCMSLWYVGARIGPIAVESLAEQAILIPFLILIVSGIKAWRDGDPNAPFVVGGYACMATGIGFSLTPWMTGPETRSGIFPGIGIACDGLLLFAALASRLERVQRESMEQARAAEEQRRLAFTDGLTGIANRRAYDEALAREWKRSSRDGTTLALVLVDVDFFKRYNDRYGHLAGDECLQRVARAAENCIRRPGDVFARYGGEEFVAVLPQADETSAFAIAEAMCAAVRDLALVHEGSSLGVVSISAGVASVVAPPFVEPTLAHSADEALYRAKERGRNRVASSQRAGEGSFVEPRPP